MLPASPRGALLATLVATFVLASVAPSPAERLELSRYGGRVGFSIGPDQFVLGGYADFGEFARNLSLRPSVDLGFGSSTFTLIGNGDVQYSFRDLEVSAVPYAGAGLTFAWSKYENGSDGAIGLTPYFGAEKGFGEWHSGYAEVRFGIGDVPDFKLVVGFGFY